MSLLLKLLKEYECSTKQIHSLYKWFDFENYLAKNFGIDQDLQHIIAEKQY